MDSDLTAAFYGGLSSVDAVEVPLADGSTEITIEFAPEPPSSDEVMDLLESEKCDVQYWLAVSCCYAGRDLFDEVERVCNSALSYFKSIHDDDSIEQIHIFTAWTHLKKAKLAETEDHRKSNVYMAIQSVRMCNQHHPYVMLVQAEVAYMNGSYADCLKKLQEITEVKDSKLNELSQATKRNLEKFSKITDKEAREAALVKEQEFYDVSAEKFNKLDAYIQIMRGKIDFRRGRIHDSLKCFQAVLIQHPTIKPDPRVAIGLCFWTLKDRKFAAEAWERALQIDPTNTTAEVLVSLSKFDTAFKSLSDEEFATKYADALDSLKTVLQKDTKSPAGLLMRASFHFSRGEYDQVREIASTVYSEAINSKLARSDASFWLARVSFQEKRFADAQKAFKDAMELNPESTVAHFGYVQSLVARGELQDAIISLTDLVKKAPKISEMHYALGMLHAKRFETSGESGDSTGAISSLQEYVKLATQNNEPVAVTAYLTLSRFHEGSDNVEALKFLNRAVETFTSHGEEAPAELVSNVGVLHFVQGSQDSARTFFESAIAANTDDETGITLSYNVARTEEKTDEDEATKKYEEILAKTPGYMAAKMRLMFLKLIKQGSSPEIDSEIDTLLAEDPSNLEVRAFYSWYLKKTGRGFHEGLENSHNKETLTKYDSHDTYALISLANMYRAIAREIRPKNDEEKKKRKTSYHRAAQLFHKALSMDPKNAFAAQGIAIVFAEEKQTAQALEIFRRVRDAVDSYSVHVNLGHCLCELGQYSKAIQEYSIALARFSDETKDSRTLSLIGRAWFLRGSKEKSLESYAKALEFSKKSLAVSEEHHPKLVPQLQYNIAFVQFSIAQFIVRLDISKRTVEDISGAIEGLNAAIEAFSKLAELEKQAPANPEILKQRSSMGSNTLLGRLEKILTEQKEYEVQFQAKIEEAKRVRAVERAKAELEEKKRKEEQAEKEMKMKEEFEKLQEQARQWEAERESALVADDEEKPKRKKKEAVWTDEEASGDENGEKKVKQKKRRTKKKVDDEDGEEKITKPKKRRLTKKEAKFKSNEFIEDSDEELADYNDDVLERAEANIDAAGGADDDAGDEEEPEAEEKADEDVAMDGDDE